MATTTKTTRNDAARGNGLPVFYSAPEALSPARHGNAHMRPVGTNFGFARSAHAIPIMAAEMPAAIRSYPIVFVGDTLMPVAIVGIKQGENLFVNEKGGWAEPHYVPAYVRRFPFIFAGGETAGRLTLCIDRDSGLLLDAPEPGSVPLFEDGQPSEATRAALKYCEQFRAMHAGTTAMVELISRHKLFARREGRLTLADGSVFNLTDFKVIDETALNALSDADFLELRKAGALALIYCQLASMNSWTSLIHQAKARR